MRMEYSYFPSIHETQVSSCMCISAEEFESLLKSIQLLRIAQLRYIVQKFSLPASGNKSKLLTLICQIIRSLRFSSILVQIRDEVNTLLAEQNDSPSELPMTSSILMSKPSPEFIFPVFPMYNRVSDFCFGPLLAPTGLSEGHFTFEIQDVESNLFLDFGFFNGAVTPFELLCELDGITFFVDENDPFPQPINISHCIHSQNSSHKFLIKKLNTTSPLQIGMHLYDQVDLSSLGSSILGRPVTLDDNIYVRGQNCNHPPFQLFPYLSQVLSSGNWDCTICYAEITPETIIEMNPPESD